MASLKLQFAVSMNKNPYFHKPGDAEGIILLPSVSDRDWHGMTLNLTKPKGMLMLGFGEVGRKEWVGTQGLLTDDRVGLFWKWTTETDDQAAAQDMAHASVDIARRMGWVKDEDVAATSAVVVDPTSGQRTEIVYSEHLVGLLYLSAISDDVLQTVIENKTGSPQYYGLARTVIIDVLLPYVSSLLDMLRSHYGQYWLPTIPGPLSSWRFPKVHELKVGSEVPPDVQAAICYFCQHVFSVEAQTDNGQEWMPFYSVPFYESWLLGDDSFLPFKHSLPFKSFLRTADWEELTDLVREKHKVRLAAEILSTAYGLLQTQQFTHALIEGITALEVALDHYTRDNCQALFNDKRFQDLPLLRRLKRVAQEKSVVTPEDVDAVRHMYELRNQAVHEGTWKPADNNSDYEGILGLLQVVAKLIPGPAFRFVYPPEYQY